MGQVLRRSVFLSLFAVLMMAPRLHAAPLCDNRDFRGVYGMQAKGDIFGVILPAFNPTIGPVVRVSRVVADGAGHVNADSYASYNGFFLHETFSGVYQINDDCSIRYDLVVPLPFECTIYKTHPACANTSDTFVGVPVPFVFNGSVIEGGADIAISLASPNGATVRVHLQRQNDNTFVSPVCSERDLTGVFQLDMDGKVIDLPPLTAGPFTRSGSLSFDGRGAFSGRTFTNYVFTGAASEEVLTGTYSMTRDCVFTMRYTQQGNQYSWLGVVTNNGHGAFIMVSTPGAVIAGTLLQARGGSGG
jgi:hypothetical protein